MSLRSSLTPVALVVGSLFTAQLATAQQAGRVRPPASRAGSGFVAARHLVELETPDTMRSGAYLSGDLDGDGDEDLLACAWPPPDGYPFREPTGMQTWLNDGSGRFALAHELAFAPWFLAEIRLAATAFVADLSGDGVLDLAYDRFDRRGLVSDGVLVHLGLGDGSFGTELLIPTHGPPQTFLLGDCDGDGDADVLVHDTESGTDDRDALTWWRLEGGSFVPGPPLVLDGDIPMRASAMDADGDGITDVLGGTFVTFDALQVFRTVNGTPVLDTTVPLTSSFHNINQRHRAGDIDGDGRTDIVLSLETTSSDPNPYEFRLQVFLGNGAGFDPMPPQVFENPVFDRPYPTEAELADWDADGDLDLVFPSFAWLENTDGVHFEPAGAQLSGGGGNYSPLHVRDFDGDGHLDVLCRHSTYSGDGTFPLRTSVPPRSEYDGSPWDAVEDWDGDGDLDLTGPNRVALNSGDGTFVARSLILDLPSPYSPSLVALGDFDGDGLRDALAASYHYGFEEMVLFLATDQGSYALSSIEPSPIQIPGGALSGDLDGDGDVDVLGTGGHWPNDGTARFGALVASYPGTPFLPRDGDGDGDLDLLVEHLGRVVYLENLGAALAFAASDLGPCDPEELPVLLDADQDGDLDLLVARPSGGVVELREHLSGGFAAPHFLAAPGLNGQVGLGDIDGDGRLELLTSRRFTDTVWPLPQLIVAWPRLEGLQYGPRQEWITRYPVEFFADLDGDGDVDARGPQMFRNLLFDGPADGALVQYGLDAATSGTGGRFPILGSGGPARGRVELVIARGRGGASGFVLIGTSRTDVPDAGFRRLVDPGNVARFITLGGAPGVAAAGTLRHRIPVKASLIGRTFLFQVVLLDPGASTGVSATNGLEVRFGDWPR
ncbi:MAG TPA: VCBS repeat-containing protein [Planctomycetota bacterium]